jgi:membrane-bound lytic murein transglycosylase MltF
VEKKTEVDSFLERETDHVRRALENASRHFDEHDKLDVHTLEAVYAKESSFGVNLKTRGGDTAGHFQIRIVTADRFKINYSGKNDQRFDVDDSAWVAAKYLKTLDTIFRKGLTLKETLKASVVADAIERKKFAVAAYNGGEGRIAEAQKLAAANGKDPAVWNEVKAFLQEAGAVDGKDIEIREYVEKILAFEEEFVEKSAADKTAKNEKPLTLEEIKGDCRWRTINGNPVCLEDGS